MPTPADYLTGLRRELRAAEQIGKDTVAEIRAEIARVEDLLGIKPVSRAVDSAPVETATQSRARSRKG